MVGLKIGLDIGSGTVTAAVEGKGVVLAEPAVLAIESETGKVLAAGEEACRMTGRCPDAIRLTRPLLGSGIAELEATQELLRIFLEKICKNKVFKPTVVATMPAGITNLEKRNLLGCVLRAGAGRAALLEEPLAAALGIGVMTDKPYGTMIVNVGAGTTGVAVITMGSIAVAKTAPVGGNAMDEEIKRYLKVNRGVAVGRLTSEDLKKTLGGAKMRDEAIAAIARGKELSDGMPLYFEVTAQEVNFAIRDSVASICETVTSVLEVTPPELIRDITDDGIFLCGGLSELFGLDEAISAATGIRVKIPGNVKGVAALGCLRALTTENYLAEIGYPFVTLETLDL